jgi:hypothetical protein
MSEVYEEFVRGEIRAALQEVVRAAEARIQHGTDRVEDEASRAVGDCASSALRERLAVWAASELTCPGVEESPNRVPSVADWGLAKRSGVCACKPWTVVDGRGVYLKPGDDLSEIRGWDRTGGCPHHPIEGKPVCGAPALNGKLTCSLGVHGVDIRHSGGGSSWPNRDGEAVPNDPGGVEDTWWAFAVPVQVNVEAFIELVGERPDMTNVKGLVKEALAKSLVLRVAGGRA